VSVNLEAASGAHVRRRARPVGEGAEITKTWHS
jgi:hypothetical protein